MKIQCNCGTKYSLDVTPEMARSPVRLSCQTCGLDISEQVNQLIRMELGVSAPPPPAAAAPVGVPVAVATPVATARKAVPTSDPGSGPAPGPYAPEPCRKHIGEFATHRCLVCQKPICPKCMELFGYVCSPLCREKAEARRMEIPVYEHQMSVVQQTQGRKVLRMSLAASSVVLVVLGVWFWYAWMASVPKVAVSVQLPEASYSGQCRLLAQDQAVWLHGGTLTRYDLKAGRQVWSQQVINQEQLAMLVATERERWNFVRQKVRKQGVEIDDSNDLLAARLAGGMERMMLTRLNLHVRGANVWVSFPNKLARYDWQTGALVQEIPSGTNAAQLVSHGSECLLISEQNSGEQTVRRVDLASGELGAEEVLAPESRPELAGSALARGNGAAAGASAARPLDPADIAARAQNLPVGARLALPATLSAHANQQRLMAEMRDPSERRPDAGAETDPVQDSALFPTENGFVQVRVKLLELKIVMRQALKERPAKSALEGTVNAAATTAIANEIFNEMQRDRGGDVVREDASRYQVSLRSQGGGGAEDWTGEVIGRPQFFPLKRVAVLTAGKTVLVFDPSNKKLWESTLNFPVGRGWDEDASGETRSFGRGPCVEQGGTLYIIDQGVLTAFELATGNVRWRLPSVGVIGLHFDDQGMIYVNTTTASHEKLKYSHQIDISEKIHQAVLKVDPKTGKTLWRAERDGLISGISGKFIYTVQSHSGQEGLDPSVPALGNIPAYVLIKRLDPGNGRVLWEYRQPRAPLDVRFEKNRIQLLFEQEMQVLKFMSLL